MDGFLTITDSLSSFPRDNIPFEERIINQSSKRHNIRARKVTGKNIMHCLDIVRNKSLDLKHFANSVKFSKAYIMLGFAESRYKTTQSWQIWFEVCLKSIVLELKECGYDICLCLPCIKSDNMPSEHRDWLNKALESIKSVSASLNCQTLNMGLISTKDWRYPEYSSISSLAKSISSNLEYSINSKQIKHTKCLENKRTFILRG